MSDSEKKSEAAPMKATVGTVITVRLHVRGPTDLVGECMRWVLLQYDGSAIGSGPIEGHPGWHWWIVSLELPAAHATVEWLKARGVEHIEGGT